MAVSRNRRKNGTSHKEVITKRRAKIKHEKIIQFHKDRKAYEAYIKEQQEMMVANGQLPASAQIDADEEE